MNINCQLKISPSVRSIPAKADNTKCHWLPLWLHLTDTAYIIRQLLSERIPEITKKAMADNQLDEEQLTQLCIFLGAVHDIAKATPSFICKMLSAIEGIDRLLVNSGVPLCSPHDMNNIGASPHALAGETLLLHFDCSKSVAAIVGAHHGKPRSSCIDDPENQQLEAHFQNYYGSENTETIWDGIHRSFLKFALDLAGYTSVDEITEVSLQSQVLLTGLLIMSDWIASNTRYFPLITIESDGTEIYPNERGKAAWESLSLPELWHPCCYRMNDKLFGKRFHTTDILFTPNEVQRAFIAAAEQTEHPGLFILEAQMGVGKTEAALSAAEILASRTGCGGLYFGLPTQATANGIFSRLEEWGNTQSHDTAHSITLAHGRAEFNDDFQSLYNGTSNINDDTVDSDSGLMVHSWFTGRKQALLADFVIGTIDKLLLSALKQKHIMLYHLGLAGKIVIIDECHAYDTYMSQYLYRAISWLGTNNIPVIILSATLPAQRRCALIEAYTKPDKNDDNSWRQSRGYPLLTFTDGNHIKQQIIPLAPDDREVEIHNICDDDIVPLLSEYFSSEGCVGIVVNTVKRAQMIAEELRLKFPDCRVIDYHAGFIMPDRTRKEKTILSLTGKKSTFADRSRLIIVGTQVLEQSLDIDFDMMITDLCPMDLLLQRIGRLHRHKNRIRDGKFNKAVCYILGAGETELEAGSKAIYGEWLLDRTKARIPEKIVIPRDIPALVQDVYNEELELLSDKQKAEIEKTAFEADYQKESNKAKTYLLQKPPKKPNTKVFTGWLDVNATVNDANAEASVRDGLDSVEVIVLLYDGKRGITFLPSQDDGTVMFADILPDENSCRKIAAQRLRLPYVFSQEWVIDKVISELENRTKAILPEWWQSHLLHGELFLLLDKTMSARVCGYELHYSEADGISYEQIKDKTE